MPSRSCFDQVTY